MGTTSATDAPAEGATPAVIKSRRQRLWNSMRVRFQLLLLLGLLLVEPHWYLAGVPLILLGQVLRAWAAGHISKDRQLATGGPYALCRHPLYLGTFLSSVGMCVLVGKWQVAVITAAVFAIIYIPTIRGEEAYLRKVYDREFEDYAARVPVFVPRLRASHEAAPHQWTWRQLLRNEEHLTWIAMTVFVIAMILKQRWL